MLKIFPILLLCCSLHTVAQTRQSALDALEKQYQHCLGEGRHAYSCALTFYRQVDSLLTSTYRLLYTALDTSRRQSLAVSQHQWLEKKEEYFRKIDERVEKHHKKTMEGLDDNMISTDNKATYLKDRLMALLDEYNGNGQTTY